MPGAFEIVMGERKALVDKIIGMMKQGYFFNKEEWDRASAAESAVKGTVQRRQPSAADGHGRRTWLYGPAMGDRKAVLGEGLFHQEGRTWSPL